jgi:GNAT superfamily N-acetyltransferase
VRIAARPFHEEPRAPVTEAAVAAAEVVAAGAAPARTLIAFLEAADPRAGSAYERLGFTEVERSRISTCRLDVGRLPDGPPPTGIRLTTLAAQPDLLPALHALEVDAFRRIPTVVPYQPEPLEPWREDLVAAVAGDLSLVHVAIDDASGETAGLVVVSPPGSAGDGGYIRFTGVARTHLRRGIARALKVAVAREGLRRGWTTLRAANNTTNDAVLRLNEQLGYEPTGVRTLLERERD